jgi:hypothetical protein
MAQATTGALLTTGRQVPYGFGWFVERTAGHDMQRHAGRVPGFGAFIMHLAGPGLWVAVMANTTPPSPVLLMALTAAEAFSPGSTFLSLPPEADGRDPRTLRARQMLERTGPPDLDWFAPEMQVLLRSGGEGFQASLPGRLPPLDRVEPIESYPVPGGQMVRYRASLGDHVAHYLFGWTDDDKIFWSS